MTLSSPHYSITVTNNESQSTTAAVSVPASKVFTCSTWYHSPGVEQLNKEEKQVIIIIIITIWKGTLHCSIH